MTTLRSRFTDTTGSMPVAMLLVSFALVTTIALGSVMAWQIASARDQQLSTTAQWALTSSVNQAVGFVISGGPDVSDFTTTPPSTWIPAETGEYSWRWWVIEHTQAGGAPTVEVIAEVTLHGGAAALSADGTAQRVSEVLRFDTSIHTWERFYTPQRTTQG